MGRLLDEDDVIDAVQQHREGVLGGYEYDEGVAFVYAAAHNHIIEVVKQLPPAQPEVVRCKDCKYSEHWYKDKTRCFLWHETGIDVFEDGYCNYAKRRTDEDVRGEQDE